MGALTSSRHTKYQPQHIYKKSNINLKRVKRSDLSFFFLSCLIFSYVIVVVAAVALVQFNRNLGHACT